MEDSWPMDSLRHQKEKGKRREAERKEEEREQWGSSLLIIVFKV